MRWVREWPLQRRHRCTCGETLYLRRDLERAATTDGSARRSRNHKAGFPVRALRKVSLHDEHPESIGNADLLIQFTSQGLMSTLHHLVRNLREYLGSALREVRVAISPVPHPDAWLFIVGCYNSGTTLLATLLSTHGEMSVLPTEGQFLTDQLTRDYALGLPRMWHKREDLFRMNESDSGPDVQRLKKEWGFRLDRSKPVLVEKSPPNTARTRWLQAHFENPHFLFLVRNAYAVAEGIVRKGEPHHRTGGWTITEAATQWRRSIEVIDEDGPHLKKLLWIRYEDLTQDPVPTLTRITEFLGLRPYARRNLPESVQVHERSEAISDLNAQSIARLTPEEIRTINTIAGGYLERFGYPVIQA